MKLNELSNLSNIIGQLKTVINTSGHGRFPKETMFSLKQKVAVLEEQFVRGVLENETEEKVTAKVVFDRIKEAKAELATPSSKEVERASKNVQSASGLTVIDPSSSEEGSLPVTTEAVNDRQDLAVSSRLAEEKQKLLAKGKRKAAAK